MRYCIYHTQKQDDLIREKTRFLQYETLYEELDEVLLDHALQEETESASDAQVICSITLHLHCDVRAIIAIINSLFRRMKFTTVFLL